jgi:hypothetical protein
MPSKKKPVPAATPATPSPEAVREALEALEAFLANGTACLRLGLLHRSEDGVTRVYRRPGQLEMWQAAVQQARQRAVRGEPWR